MMIDPCPQNGFRGRIASDLFIEQFINSVGSLRLSYHDAISSLRWIVDRLHKTMIRLHFLKVPIVSPSKPV